MSDLYEENRVLYKVVVYDGCNGSGESFEEVDIEVEVE